MKLKQALHYGLVIGGLVLAADLFTLPARANVYATNIKLNGGGTNAIAAIGDSVNISYILNEPASRGLTVDILAGTSTVRTLTFAASDPQAQRGLQTVTWDGRDANSNNVPPGAYSVSITAASSGYQNWTQTTVDADPTYIWAGRGIAVDQNTNSRFYGRIFVANSLTGPSPDLRAGDAIGILKMNADGSPADEGIVNTNQDGHVWTGNDVSPLKLTVSADDFVYVDDLANGGEIYRWDPTLSSNAFAFVLRTNNQPGGVQLIGPVVTGSGTNTQLWMADNGSTHGILNWKVTSDGTCAPNDHGATVVGLGTNLTFSAVALDKRGNIYTCQPITGFGDARPRVFMYPAYDPSTNGNAPELTPAWMVGAGDDNYGGASGVAVDPTGTYLAVSFEGVGTGLPANGNTKILYATNGSLAIELDLGVAMDGQFDTEHQNRDCAWDAVGNVYYIDNWYGYWRVFSPPGTNQATTVAVIQVLVQSPSPPVITGLSVSNGTVNLRFTSSTADTAGLFTVVGSAVVTGGYSAVAAANITLVSPGVFNATFPAEGPVRFYRIRK